jgi:hypothetical protein
MSTYNTWNSSKDVLQNQQLSLDAIRQPLAVSAGRGLEFLGDADCLFDFVQFVVVVVSLEEGGDFLELGLIALGVEVRLEGRGEVIGMFARFVGRSRRGLGGGDCG